MIYKISIILNLMVEFEIFVAIYLVRRSRVAYQMGYVSEGCPHRQYQTASPCLYAFRVAQSESWVCLTPSDKDQSHSKAKLRKNVLGHGSTTSADDLSPMRIDFSPH